MWHQRFLQAEKATSTISATLYYLFKHSKFKNQRVAVKSKGRDSKKRKSKVEIVTDFIKLNDEIPVCVAATVDDLLVLKLQISVIAYDNEFLKVRLEESESRISFLEEEEKVLMKILNAKMTFASCNFKTS